MDEEVVQGIPYPFAACCAGCETTEEIERTLGIPISLCIDT